MTIFKKGDRVEVIAAEDQGSYKTGSTGVVVKSPSRPEDGFYVEFDHGPVRFVYKREVQHIAPVPAPPVIAINRADLPEVREEGRHLHAGVHIFGRYLDAAGHRKAALAQLAVAEHLAAAERRAKENTAAQSTAHALQRRRDTLVRQFTDNAVAAYESARPSLKRAVDRIIELQDAANVDK